MQMHDTWADIAKLVQTGAQTYATIRAPAPAPSTSYPLPSILPPAPSAGTGVVGQYPSPAPSLMGGMSSSDLAILLAIGGVGLVVLIFAMRR